MTGRARCLLVGLGNSLRGDDGAGVLLVEQVRQTLAPDVTVRLERDPLRLLDDWCEFARVWLVDAVRTGAAPGTLHWWQGEDLLCHGREVTSSHSLGLGELLDLAEITNQRPERLQVLGIEGQQFGLGQGLSPAVAAAVPEAAAALCRQLSRGRHGAARRRTMSSASQCTS